MPQNSQIIEHKTFQQLHKRQGGRNTSRIHASESIHTHEPASPGVFSCSIREYVDYEFRQEKEKQDYTHAWEKALDKRDIRLATIDKRPDYEKGTHWPSIKEHRNRKELLGEYNYWGTRTGKQVGRKYRIIFDLDLSRFNHTPKYKALLEKGFLMIMSRYKRTGSHYNKTANGYHATILLNEPCPNGIIYHINKWGKEERIGEILSDGRHAQWIGGKAPKTAAGQGKWALQFKNANEAEQLFNKYFFRIKWTSKEVIKEKQTEINTDNIKVYNEKETSEILSDFISKGKYTSERVENAQIVDIKKWAKKDKHYLIWYKTERQELRTALLDGYYRAGGTEAKIKMYLNGLWTPQPKTLHLIKGYRRTFLLSYDTRTEAVL